MSQKCATLKKAKNVATEGDTMDDMETYLILKYGSLHRAYNLWANLKLAMILDQAEYDAINTFFAIMPLNERIGLGKKPQLTTWRDDRRQNTNTTNS